MELLIFNKMSIQLCFDGSEITYDFCLSSFNTLSYCKCKKNSLFEYYLMNKKSCPVNCESVEEHVE